MKHKTPLILKFLSNNLIINQKYIFLAKNKTKNNFRLDYSLG